jgi:hypothetical protein
MGLDSSILTTVSEGNLQSLKLGWMDFADENVRKKILSRVDDPEQFEDLMVELHIGAWHQLEKHSVEYREKTGFPDFNIGMKGVEIPALVECKRARTTVLDQKVRSRTKIR